MLRLQLHHVYILEAHPVDGWVDADNVSEGVCLRQAKTFDQRVAAAEALVRIRLRQNLTRIVYFSRDPKQKKYCGSFGQGSVGTYVYQNAERSDDIQCNIYIF